MAHGPQAYDLVVKALEDKNAANAALAQAHSQLEDLKETLARARQAEHDADETPLTRPLMQQSPEPSGETDASLA